MGAGGAVGLLAPLFAREGERMKRRARLVPRVKVWLETGGRYVFGFGLAEILQAVERAGSIKEGARALGKSYRYVWGRIKKAEQVLGRPLVESRVGGYGVQRSALTPEARHLANEFLAVRQAMQVAVAREFARRFSRRVPPSRRT
jgi:molybdate transport system regulatory protein